MRPSSLFLLCGFALISCKNKALTEVAKTQSARSESREIGQPTGDYWTQLQTLRAFLKREQSGLPLKALLDRGNQVAWTTAVQAGEISETPGPRNLDQWLNQRLENPEQGRIRLEDVQKCGSMTQATDECTNDDITFYKAILTKDLAYFRPQPWILMRRTYQESDWVAFWQRVHDAVRSPVASDNIETITWMAHDTYEVGVGNCLVTIHLRNDGSFDVVGGEQGLQCILQPHDRMAEKLQFGGIYKDLDYSHSLDLAVRGMDLLVAKGATYKQTKFGDNVPFYGISIDDVFVTEMQFLPHTYNIETDSSQITQSERCRVFLASKDEDLTYRCESEYAGKVAPGQMASDDLGRMGLGQISYFNPRFNGLPISHQYSDLDKVCDRLVSQYRDLRPGPARSRAIPSSITSKRIQVGKSVVVIAADGVLAFRKLATPSTAVESLICSGSAGQGYALETFCQRTTVNHNYRYEGLRFYDLGRFVPFSVSSDSGGLCLLMGADSFVTWETENQSDGGAAVVVGADGVFKMRQATASKVVRSLTCARPEGEGETEPWIRSQPWCPAP